jgi:ubiquinone/menaquinone biosynthesis C-methylase UbiE
MTSQRENFVKGEADRYFERNRSLYEATMPHNTYPLDFYARFINPKMHALEIGCGSGINLHYLEQKTHCIAHGVEPSAQAVACGSRLFPEVKLQVSTAESLPFENESMDFVLFGFCFYLVDRKLLFRAVMEADRVLKEGGNLGITDFDPLSPRVRPYRHAPGIFSYKMNYSQLFLANPSYSLVEKLSFSHSVNAFDNHPEERLSACVLYKNTHDGYVFEGDK